MMRFDIPIDESAARRYSTMTGKLLGHDGDEIGFKHPFWPACRLLRGDLSVASDLIVGAARAGSTVTIKVKRRVAEEKGLF